MVSYGGSDSASESSVDCSERSDVSASPVDENDYAALKSGVCDWRKAVGVRKCSDGGLESGYESSCRVSD